MRKSLQMAAKASRSRAGRSSGLEIEGGGAGGCLEDPQEPGDGPSRGHRPSAGCRRKLSRPTSGDLRRARTVSELQEVMSRFSTKQGFALGLAFEPHPSDVFVATYPKCGTTLMQQIVHGLRTGGDMDFRDISEVVPWLELAADLDLDPTADQRAHPRAFKTHLGWDSLPKGGRNIYLLREPEAALISFYHFFSGWFLEPGALDLETFALEFVLSREGERDYWRHLVSWWPHRNDADVLYLLYEEVVADLAGAVRRVARFLALEEPAERVEIATRQASIDFMRRFPTLWEDLRLREKRNDAMGIPADAGSTKVRVRDPGLPVANLTEAVKTAWRRRWEEVVAPATGCVDYSELRRSIASGPT